MSTQPWTSLTLPADQEGVNALGEHVADVLARARRRKRQAQEALVEAEDELYAALKNRHLYLEEVAKRNTQPPRRVVFDESRHTWLCTPPRNCCTPHCVCHCHRPAPTEPDAMNGWIWEDEQ